MPGSSATTITRPPRTPVYAAVMNVSAATFRPTCFIVTRARVPPSDAPSATSIATFSFVDHSTWTRRSASDRTSASRISVLGVPGYPATTPTPASRAPCAIASLPERRTDLELAAIDDTERLPLTAGDDVRRDNADVDVDAERVAEIHRDALSERVRIANGRVSCLDVHLDRVERLLAIDDEPVLR